MISSNDRRDMAKSWNGKRGRDKDQEASAKRRLAYNNKELKREIARLRKQIDRMENGWCPGCLKKFEDGEHKGAPAPEDVHVMDVPKKSKDWTCFHCKVGRLELVKYYKMGEAWYYRKCSEPNCKNRTKGKKWTPEVK
jgi:hypothetical protein